MSAFKGTPGPWEVGETLSAEALAVIGDGDSVVCEFPDRLGASVDADARLIAAAPELLEALTKMVERITYYAELKEGDIPNIEDWAYTYNSGDMASARAAIAKAAGGAE